VYPTGRPVALAFLLLYGFALPLAVAEPPAIPLEIHGRVIFVEGRVNGQGPFKLILDTGATETVLVPPVAVQLGLRGAPVSARQMKSRVASLSVGGWEARDLPVYVFDPPQALPLRLDKGINYHGLLGYSFLSLFVTTLDYGRKTVRFTPVTEVPPTRAAVQAKRPGTLAIPFEVRQRLIHVRGTVNGKGPLTFLVDTGSAEMLIVPQTAKWLGLATVSPGGGQPGVAFAQLARVTVGDAEVGDVPGIVHLLPGEQRAGANYHGILGYPFLSRFAVTINYRDRFLLLESLPPSALPPQPPKVTSEGGFVWRPAPATK
jgi:predicted aspartyl protease